MDFDLPNAKRIRRADLSPSRSPSLSPSPEATLSLHSRLAKLYGPIPLPSAPEPTSTQNPAKPSPSLDQEQEAEQEEEIEDKGEQAFEFRLFSTPSNTTRTQKIILQPANEELGEGGFITRPRPPSFYIAPPLSSLAKSQFHFAAISSSDVLQRAKDRNWGLEVPWRVTVLSCPPSSTPPKSKSNPNPKHGSKPRGEEKGEGKTKPNKKRRIILRERERAQVLKEEVRKKEREGKEEAEREKRTRRNREKKVKRKMKEKASKAGVTSGNEEAGGEDEVGE